MKLDNNIASLVLKYSMCTLFHHSFKVIQAYSNRTHRFKCKICGREWDE